jgi:hypothetical protein
MDDFRVNQGRTSQGEREEQNILTGKEKKKKHT